MHALALLVALFSVPAVVAWFIVHYVHPVQDWIVFQRERVLAIFADALTVLTPSEDGKARRDV